MTAGSELSVEHTDIPGLIVVHLPMHGDNRGWFKENWQREKMVALGLTDFTPVQNNVSFNEEAGVTRGIHAEPWDKFVSVGSGQIFGAWVDLRQGPGFGKKVTALIGPDTAVFVPRGVGNAFQTLAPQTVYSYLVTEHWSPEASYTLVNLADPTLAIEWPIPLNEATVSDKDLNHPRLDEVVPVAPRQTLVLGANGQVGRALRREFSGDESVRFLTRDEFDLTDGDAVRSFDFSQVETVVNAAAYTAVDAAESPEGRRDAWTANAEGISNLVSALANRSVTLIGFSTDYVFDGTKTGSYSEDDPFCPQNVYGQSKAAGDLATLAHPRSYLLRVSWVVGEGKNFVETMARLAESGVSPSVIDDQVGRLTFADQIARAVRFLIERRPAYGTYNFSADGPAASWADVAREVFAKTGHPQDAVRSVSSEEYESGLDRAVAPRPRNSMLDLTKIAAAGLSPEDWREGVRTYLSARS